MRAFLVSVHGSCFAEEEFGALSKVFLVVNLDFDRGVFNVRALLIQLRLMDSVKLGLLFLLEVALHLQGAVVLLGSTESISFRQESRCSRSSVVIQEGVSVGGLGSKSGSVNEFY